MLLTVVFLAIGRGNVRGQSTRVYTQYVGPAQANTGGIDGAGGTAGGFGSAGANGTHFINNPTNINDTNYANFVGLTAQSGSNGTGALAGYGKSSTAYINLNFSGAVTPITGTPIIIKLQAGSIGLVDIQAYNGTTPVGALQAFSTLANNGPDEYVFLAPGSCNNIRITAKTENLSLLGGIASNNANIYYAYILDPTCSPASYTTTSMTTLVDLGSSFSNVTSAIDGDQSSFSSFTVGLGVGTTLYQNIYFSQLSDATDAAKIRLSIPPSALAAGVLGSITIKAYNGNTLVGSPTSFQALLQGTDVLTILQAGGISSFSFLPGGAFNRIEVSMSSLLSLATSMNLYEVQSTPPKPTFSSPAAKDISVCLGSNAVFTSTPTSGNELRWYTSATGGTAVTGNTFTPSPAPTTNTTYYVAMGKPGCTAESERVPVTATIKALPHLPAITPSINQ
ncbi:MAG: hypothetical protein V4594_10645 [Bacteroidota bacterium]